MVGTRGFRLNKIKGYLKTEVLKHIEAWEHAHADVRFIYELSRASNLEAKGSVQASRIEALAIVFWAQKYKIPLEQCCDDHMLVEKMAKIIYHLKISCDKLDTILHRKIGLRWCDLFPSWLPNKDSLVKLNTLASSVAGLAAMKKRPVEEARDQLKALMTLIPQASKPTAKLIGRIVARFEAHRAEIGKLLITSLHELSFCPFSPYAVLARAFYICHLFQPALPQRLLY